MNDAMTPRALIERLVRATNDHDLDALVSCFALDYRNETPVHPSRGFSGSPQVRKNWAQIFGGVPDLTTEVRWTVDTSTVWSEWEMRGTRRDGSPHLMRGVSIFSVDGDQFSSCRFDVDPVDAGGGTVDEAVRRQVGGGSIESPR